MADWIKVEPKLSEYKRPYNPYIRHVPDLIKIRPSKKKKKIMAKVLYEAGFGSKQLGYWFKTNQSNIPNWAKKPTPEGLKEFEASFRLALKDADMENLALVSHRMKELIPSETDLLKLTKVGEYLRGDRRGGNATQVNVYTDLLKKYSDGVEYPQTVVETHKLK